MEDPFPIKLIIAHPASLGKAGRLQKFRRKGRHEPSMHLLLVSREAFNTSAFLSPGLFSKAFPTTHILGMPPQGKESEK